MSQAPGDIHSLPPSADAHSDDGMNLTKIIVVGVISLVIFALSAVVAWWILRDDTATYTQRGIAPQMTGLNKKQEIGIVDLPHFDDDLRLDEWRAQKAKQATSYGWADRAKGLVRIPIEEAMKEVVRQAQSGAAPRGTAAPATGGAQR